MHANLVASLDKHKNLSLVFDKESNRKNDNTCKSYNSIDFRLEEGTYYNDTSDLHSQETEENHGESEESKHSNNEDFFFTDEITYINIIFNILNFIYATNIEPKRDENTKQNETSTVLPLHLLYDRIYLQYCNIMNNKNIDRFIINDYNDIGLALDYYIVHYLNFINLQNDVVKMSLFEEEHIPFNYCTPNLVSKCESDDELLYILQHHIGGIRNSQSFITNELMFNENDKTQVVKKLLEQKLQRKRFMYLDHDKEVYWIITIDNFQNNDAIITIMPLSLIVNENNNNTTSTRRLINRNKEVFIANKLLNFMFFEKIRTANVSNFTIYQYMLNKLNYSEKQKGEDEQKEEEVEEEDDVIMNRIIETGGFNKNYKEIKKPPKEKKFNTMNRYNKNSKLSAASNANGSIDSLIISKSPGRFSSPSSPTLAMTRSRTNSYPYNIGFEQNTKMHYTHNTDLDNYHINKRSVSHYTVDSTSLSTSEYSPGNSALIFKNIMILMSPISKAIIFSILLQIKKQNQKNTKIIISNSWRFLLAASLFASIMFTFTNLIFLAFGVYEIIMCCIDMILVFALLFGVLVWVL